MFPGTADIISYFHWGYNINNKPNTENNIANKDGPKPNKKDKDKDNIIKLNETITLNTTKTKYIVFIDFNRISLLNLKSNKLEIKS